MDNQFQTPPTLQPLIVIVNNRREAFNGQAIIFNIGPSHT